MNYSVANIGPIIKQERLRRKLTQKELGFIIGTTGKQISCYENGACVPSIELLFALCSVFNVTIGYLCCENPCEKRMDDVIREELGLSIKEYDFLKNILRRDNN